MSSANSPEKKRKRTSESPLSLTQRPNKMATNSGSQAVQQSTSGQPSEALGPGAFWNLLKDDEFGDVNKSRDNGQSINVALEEYAKAHSGLLATEANEAWDYTAISNASSLERRAAQIIRVLREYERVVIFGNTASEAIPGPDTLDMGGQFLTNKTRIEGRSKIFQIAKELQVDLVLLGGDLFHDNKPTRNTLVRAMNIIQEYSFCDDPVRFQILSNEAENFVSG